MSNMQTVYITIGNSDNKLSQFSWHQFCKELEACVTSFSGTKHFVGFSLPDSQYQTMCICAEVSGEAIRPLRFHLSGLARLYKQDSIALAEAKVTFVEA